MLIIRQSIPATRQLLQDSVMADLTGWLVGIREKSTDIGEIAFRQTERKRDEWRRISENDPVLSNASFNSALERVFDEQDDCTSTCGSMLIESRSPAQSNHRRRISTIV
jgi:hypothetical protein